jgi:hypothetical protein
MVIWLDEYALVCECIGERRGLRVTSGRADVVSTAVESLDRHAEGRGEGVDVIGPAWCAFRYQGISEMLQMRISGIKRGLVPVGSQRD